MSVETCGIVNQIKIGVHKVGVNGHTPLTTLPNFKCFMSICIKHHLVL